MKFKIIDVKAYGDPIGSALGSPTVQAKTTYFIERIFMQQVDVLVKEVIKDPVSQEISNPSVGNISATLQGVGDLFGFIGFHAGSNPIGKLIEVIKEQTRLKKPINYGRIYPMATIPGKGNRFIPGRRPTFITFKFQVPTLEDFQKASDSVTSPSETGIRNWVRGIERGMSGFGAFLPLKDLEKSRSKRGIQKRLIFRDGAYKPRQYMSKYIKTFISRVKTGGVKVAGLSKSQALNLPLI